MRPFTVIVVACVTIAGGGSAFAVGQYMERVARQLEQEGSGGGQKERANIQPPEIQKPPPPEQQQEITDFEPVPVKLGEEGILIPVDPEERRKAQLAIDHWEWSKAAYETAWMILAAGLALIVLAFFWERSKSVADTPSDQNGGEQCDTSSSSMTLVDSRPTTPLESFPDCSGR